MEKMVEKKSQSEVITTVLIILLVLAAVFIVYVAVRNMVKGGTEKATTTPLDVSLTTSSTSLFQSPVNISVSREAGEGNLSSVIVIFRDSAGAQVCRYVNTTSLPGELETIIYSINLSLTLGCTENPIYSYEVYPVLKGGIIGLKAIKTKNNYVSPVTGAVVESISECRVLNVSNTVYTLQNDVLGVSGTCFNITANNIVLDGAGFIIDGDDDEHDYGIYVSGFNSTTIRNFANITDFDHGIYLESSSNNILTGITSNSNTQRGIYLYSNSNYNTLTNIVSNSNNAHGILIEMSLNNILTNITTSLSIGRGIALSGSSNNILTNIISDSNKYNRGIWLSYSSNNTLTGITATSNTYGVSLSPTSNNNILTNITANNNTVVGIYLESSSNNILTGITANNNSNTGVYLTSNSNNNQINKSTACKNSVYDVYCSGSSGTTGTGNTFGSGKVQTTCTWPAVSDYQSC